MDNIGIVCDQFSQVHAVLDESKQDFERDRLSLHEISVKSDSGRALGIELNVEQLRTLPTVERFGLIRKGFRRFLNRRRVAGWELEGLMGRGPPQTGDLSLFRGVYQFARKFYHRREPLWTSARAELDVFWSHDLDRVRFASDAPLLQLMRSTEFLLESVRCRYGGSSSGKKKMEIRSCTCPSSCL